MKLLRTISTRRLLALIASLIAAIAAGTAIAVAAAGSGPVPPPKPLASALHQAATAPAVQGVSGRVSFTNHLIASSNIQGSDPILTGASGRFWISADGRMRLELQSDIGDAQVMVNNGAFWVFDPSSNTVYEGNLPSGGSSTKSEKRHAKHDQIPSIGTIQSYLNRLVARANVSGPIPGDVAGHAAYTVQVSPKHSGGLLGDVQLAWDAARGVPLRIAVYARGDGTPVLELKVTDISYGAVQTSDFAAGPPAGAKVVKVSTPGGAGQGAAADRATDKRHRGNAHKQITGAAAVARHLPFKLVAPRTLVGLPRQSVSLLDWGGHPAALVTYGQGLGGIAVIEQGGGSAGTAASQSGDHRGLSLPTVSIHGRTGQELDTALGTVVRFTRGGVAYTVIGSVPAAAADAAARAL